MTPIVTIRRRLAAVLTLTSLIGPMLLACGAPTAWSTAWSTSRPAALAWRDCGEGVQCATMTVPVDWTRPDGPRTVINVERLPARDPARSRGPLVANFKSGASAFLLHGPRPPVINELTTWFDIVAIDARGLGRADNATLVRCAEPPPPTDGLVLARTEADWQAHAARNATYDASCRAAAGDAFAGLTSWQVAHDLDALRAALGQDTLRYLGNSYGTVYGQAYAQLFPTRVGRMYLDGVADHTQPELEDWLRSYALTQEQQLLRFRDWCNQRVSCALHGSDAATVWVELVTRADRAPLPAPGAGPGQTVTVEQLFAGALVGMNPPRWPKLAQAMAAARAGDAGQFHTVLRPAPPEPFVLVSNALLCHDFMPVQPSYQEFLALETRLRALAPAFGWIEGRYELGRCLGIRGEPSYPPQPMSAPGLAPILIGIGELDNLTPNLGAARVAAQLPSARVVHHGDGHAAYLLGNTCLAGHVHGYLIDGQLPPPGTRCPAELATRI